MSSRAGVAVVTGSSTGIGRATALRLARDGFLVIATMRRPEASDIDDVAAAEGLSLTSATLDVTSDESVEALFAAVHDEHGPVDVLVANAGVGGGGGPMELASLDVYRDTMETNLFGVIRCAQAVLPAMRERGSGTIVAMSSMAGRIAPPTMSAYVASKWALEGVMESLAGSVVPFGIRVAIIEPGVILTPIFEKGDLGPPSVYQDATDALLGVLMHDLARASDPSVVADCVSEAVLTDRPRLRYPVGQGADRNVRIRAAMTDEEYVDLNLLPVDEQVARLLAGEA